MDAKEIIPIRHSSADEMYEEAAATYGAALARLARAYEADPDRRQDLLQEIHLALWRSFEGFAGRCSLRTWVYRVAHNAAASYVVRQRRRKATLVSLEEIEFWPGTDQWEFTPDRQEALERLFRLVQSLKPLDRQVILSYLEGMDAASTAEIIGISPANVAMKIHRIKEILARRFQQGEPMANNLPPDDARHLWQNQPVQPITIPVEMIRRKARSLEATVRWGYRAAWAVLIGLTGGFGLLFFAFPQVVQRIGSCLAVAGYLYGAYQLYRRGPARSVPSDPAAATRAAYRAELERQRDFHLGVWSRLVAFVPGPVVFILGSAAPDLGPLRATALAAALVLAPFVAGVPLNRYSARKLQREIDALDEVRARP